MKTNEGTCYIRIYPVRFFYMLSTKSCCSFVCIKDHSTHPSRHVKVDEYNIHVVAELDATPLFLLHPHQEDRTNQVEVMNEVCHDCDNSH